MCTFDIKVAGLTFHIESQHAGCIRLCEKYLISDEGEFKIYISQEDIDQERINFKSEDGIDEDLHTAPDGFVETICLLRKLANEITLHNRLLMHGSAIAIDGKGYIFTALSGTGKSTHTALLRQKFGDRAVMVNDDKPFLVFDHDQVYVCGTPWNGKHNLDNNIMVPLKGIFFLRRAEENHISTMDSEHALSLLVAQCFRPTDALKMMSTLEMLDKLLTVVPLYDFGCNMDISAADVSASVMK